jgi:hypothetical protein
MANLVLLRKSPRQSADTTSTIQPTFLSSRRNKWITLKSEAPIEKLAVEQIKAALDAGLARKGLTKVDFDC